MTGPFRAGKVRSRIRAVMGFLRRAAPFLPAALVYAIIFLLSGQSKFPISEPFSSFDKLVHVSEFALLGAALAFGHYAGRTRGTEGRRPVRSWLGIWAVGAGLGLLDEVHQIFVPGRNPDAADAAVDALGIALGIGLFWLLRRRAGTRA
jgi:VanZ family protein